MRVLADDQYNELTEHIKQLEAEMRIVSRSVAKALIEEHTTE